MKASDLDDNAVLDLIRECNEARCTYPHDAGYHGGRPGYGEHDENPPTGHWANRMDMTAKFDVPTKVLLAKMRRLIDCGLVLGCACGCRGDFVLAELGYGILGVPFPDTLTPETFQRKEN